MKTRNKIIILLTPVLLIVTFIILYSVFYQNDYTNKLKNIQYGKEDLNIILISIDTCNAYNLSPYGYDIETPTIQKLADEGTTFLNARTPVPLTLPAHSAMFTGKNPPGIGVHDNYQYFQDDYNETITEILKSEGYNTGAFIGGLPLDEIFGFNQGFDYYWDDLVRSSYDKYGNLSSVKAEVVIDEAINWIDDNSSSKYFAFIHLFDPHFPYLPPEPYNTEYKQKTYDGELAYVDSAIDKLINWIKLNQSEKNTLIVLTADHGEAFGKHFELEHGYFIYNHTLHIPLIFWSPGLVPENNTISEKVSLIDIAPTIYDILGAGKNTECEGISLLPAIFNNEKIEREPVYYESFKCFYSLGYSKLFGIEKGDWKYILAPEPELYNLKEDPDEENNVYNEYPDIVFEMDEELNKIIEQSLNNSSIQETYADIDKKTEDALSSLGYISGGSELETSSNIDPKQMAEAFYKATEIWLSIAMHENKYDENDLLTLLQNEPEKQDILFILGKYQMSRGKTDKGLEYLERAFEISPENRGLKFSLAKTYYDIADYKKAKQFLLDIINDENLEDLLLIRNSYILMSQILYSEGNGEDAIEYITNAIEIDDKSTDAYYIGALIYFEKLKNFKNAELYASKFLNITQSGPRADKMNEILKVCGNLK